ncbi:MAG: hypothetical protein E7055_05550 [Lentisphaerae bacterium]|nr:hypothetical protein [Lentisphaerota bacterium]
MGFLSKHYEKILLAVLLTVFIGLLAVQVLLWRQNEQIQVEKLKGFQDPPPNYQPVKFGDEKSPFLVLENLPKKPDFAKAQPRERNTSQMDSQILYTNLMVPYPMALCPYCNRVIPANAFPAGDGESKCPLEDCQKTLHAPFNVVSEKEQDSDGDGIPDKEEIRLGLNPKFAADASADADGDEYSNYEEYICKTDCNNAKSRPPYHEKMMIRPIRRRKLLFQVKRVSFGDKTKKETARIELSIEKPGALVRYQTAFVKLGDIFPKTATVTSSDAVRNIQKYKIVDVIPKFVKSGGSEINESEVVVQRVIRNTEKTDGVPIHAKIGREVFEPKIRADLILGSRAFEIYVGSKISHGTINTGTDRYTVGAIDEKKNTVTLKYTGDNPALIGKQFEIKQDSMLQTKIDAVKSANRPRRGRRRAASDNQK